MLLFYHLIHNHNIYYKTQNKKNAEKFTFSSSNAKPELVQPGLRNLTNYSQHAGNDLVTVGVLGDPVEGPGHGNGEQQTSCGRDLG